MNNHLSIPVKHLKESKKFYEKLGFEIFDQWEKPKETLKALWMQDQTGFRIELVYHPSNKDLKLPLIPETLHLGIKTDNLEGKLKELEKQGVTIIKPITKGITVKCTDFILESICN